LTFLTRGLHSFAGTVLITVWLKLIQKAVDIPLDSRYDVHCSSLLFGLPLSPAHNLQLLAIVSLVRVWPALFFYFHFHIYIYIFVPFSHIIVCFFWWKCLLGWLPGSRRAKHTLGVGKAARKVESGG